MKKFQTLAAKLGVIGGALLVATLTSVGYTLWASWQLEGGAAAVNEAGRMRMETWRLAQTLARSDRSLFTAQADEFERSLTLLRKGDPARPLFVPRDVQAMTAFADVQRTWTRLRGRWEAYAAPDTDHAAADAGELVRHIDNLVSAIEIRLSRLTTILNLLQAFMLALIIVSAVTLLYSAYLLVLNPIERLKAGLERVRRGDLTARVDVESNDELGTLAEGFNQTTETLQKLHNNLEAEVERKTKRLAEQKARLGTLYEASQFAAHATSLSELANGFARLARKAVTANASAVRWTDEGNRRYVLLAADGLCEAVTDSEECIAVGDCHCGQEQAHALTRVIPISVEQPGPLAHCSKAGIRTVVSVPVQLQDRIIGELDLFYTAPVTLSQEDRAVVETIASHLAIALEGLRANALEREAAVTAERSLLAREMHDSIAQSLAFMKIQSGLLRSALTSSDQSRAHRAIDELDAGLHESLTDVRELLMNFRTRSTGEDIIPALRTTVQKFQHQTGMPANLSVEGHGVALPADTQVQVLHVVQEALANIRKHAGAQQVWITVRQGPEWRVEVRDDGCGFSSRLENNDGHIGIRIMHERAERVGAHVTIDSAPGSGTRVVMTLPDQRRLAA